MSPPPKPQAFFLGAEGCHLRKKNIPSKFLWREKALVKPFECQDFSTGFPPKRLPVVEQRWPVECPVIRVHPPPPPPKLSARPEIALPRGPARGLLSPAPTCLYLLYSGYQRYRPQRAKRSDKRFPPSPEWVPWLPLPLSDSPFFCIDLRPDSGPNLSLLFSPLSGDGWGKTAGSETALLGRLSSARPRLRQLARRPRGPGSAPPPPPGRAPPPRAGPALAPLGGSWARHPFLSPCGSARLYLTKPLVVYALLQTSTER